MRERVCKNCGGRSYKVVGQNMVRCQFCGTLYVDEQASKEEEVLLVGANERLRELKFAEAVEEFDKILSLYPKSFEAFWGKTLAKNKIVYYTNKRGSTKRPYFFGEEIPSIVEDEDFKSAVKNAPPEVAKSYNDKARRIEKLHKLYLENSVNENYDVFVYAVNFDKNAPDKTPEIRETVNGLEGKGLKVYFSQSLSQREKEEDTFRALQTSKAFVLFANGKTGYFDGDCKNLYDRYLYFASQKQKTKSSMIVALDTNKVSVDDLPKELVACKSVVDMSTTSFLQDIDLKVEKEMQNTINEMAKIETIKIEKVEPQKKEYVDVETINPNELGHYHVDNIELSETNKIKWIFLTLKHGDFVSAQEMIADELQKDPNNAELLFASLMSSMKINTQEEFFSNIANFKDREKIDQILKYAAKDFAEYFVDSWEKLVESLDSEEYYNAFLLYLAKFSSPNRDHFVEKAENKAVETLNSELIDKVLKCFDSNEVERFVDFYFMLAQKSDDQEYYKKILDIDAGHEQSNLAILLQHFKTDEDKLHYRNKEEIEDVFKYLSEDTRAQFVFAVTNMILPVAFLDLKQAEEQLDFYLSYISDDKKLVSFLEKIAQTFQSYGFFKQAEKYISIAISKDAEKGSLYWNLIQIKLHCKTDNELIMSNVKITQFPEWETLLSLSDEKETEKYAEIVSKVNLYKGEKLPLKEETLDKVCLKEKLQNFINRNNSILLEMEKQEGQLVYRGAEYYKLQLKPFEIYLEKLDKISTFEEYQNLFSKLCQRLDAMDLTLDSSINVTHLIDKEDGLKVVFPPKTEKQEKVKEPKDITKDKFLKRFLFIFLELFPICFAMLLLLVSVFAPKEVYMYFSQDSIVGLVLFSTAVGLINLTVFINAKQKHSKGWNVCKIVLFVVAVINLVLLFVSFYIEPNTIKIKNEHELSVLLKNANYSNMVLDRDMDMTGKTWSSANFSGTLDGQGHKILNIKLKAKKGTAFFGYNGGTIKNVEFDFAEATYKNVSTFAGIAVENKGEIKDCVISGTLKLVVNSNAVVGGVVGYDDGGQIVGCQIQLAIEIESTGKELTIGGVAGKVRLGKKSADLSKNIVSNSMTISANSEQFTFGGLAGIVEHIDGEKYNLAQNTVGTTLTATGTISDKYWVGGLVGVGYNPSKNNLTLGKLDTSALSGSGYMGGLYGKYQNPTLAEPIETSYAKIDLVAQTDKCYVGGFVGHFGGTINACFTNYAEKSYGYGAKMFDSARENNCVISSSKTYDSKLGFDSNIWNIPVDDSTCPTLKY